MKGLLENNVKLDRYNMWRVGGLAEYLFHPADREDLQEFLKADGKKPYTWLGLGSNVLIRDGGIKGTVILTQEGLKEIHQIDETTVFVESGVPCAKLAKFGAKLGLKGVEFFAGIPGTMGGALTMNAGCYGSETWQYVKQVETIDDKGVIHVHTPAEYEIAYRHVKGPAEGFISAQLHFSLENPAETQAKVKTLMQQRNASQPIGLPNCGSVFRNPEGMHAAKLIEQAGLKGYCLGDAEVSTKHANFIINKGHAHARDIENLIQHIREVVQQKSGILLQTEVKFLGEVM